MAKWPTNPSWVDPNNINKGNDYLPADGLVYKDLNALIYNLVYLKNYIDDVDANKLAGVTAEVRELNTELLSFKNSVHNTFITLEQETQESVKALDVRLTNLEDVSEGVSFKWRKDADVAYEKLIPTKAAPYAMLDRVGSATTRVFHSLLNWAAVSGQSNGNITLTCDPASGIITLNGRTEIGAYFNLYPTLQQSAEDKLVRIANVGGSVSNSESWAFIALNNANIMQMASFSFNQKSAEAKWAYDPNDQAFNELGEILISVSAGTTFDNYQIFIGVGNADTVWSLESNKPTSLVAQGKNLFNLESNPSIIGKGVTAVFDEETGIYTLNGKAEDDRVMLTFMPKERIPIEANQSYTISTEYVSGSISVKSGKVAVAYVGTIVDGANKNWMAPNLATDSTKRTSSTKQSDIDTELSKFWFYIDAETTFTDYKCKVQLERGSVATAYSNQRGTISTTALPDLSDLDGWGQGVPSVGGNYITFTEDGRVLYQRTSERIVFDGKTEPWYWEEKDGKVSHFYTRVGTTPIVFNEVGSATAVCSDYDVVDSIFNYVGQSCCSLLANAVGSCTVYIRDTAFTNKTREEWIDYVKARAESGNPIIIEYALATLPDPIDITDRFESFDGFIEAEGNGSIIAENAHKADLPSTITYQVSLREV